MIRFFGIILGFVLMTNIAVTLYQSNCEFSSLTAFVKETWQAVVEQVHKVDNREKVTQHAVVNTHVDDILAPINQPIIEESTAADLVVQVIENPIEVRIFWGPFNTRGAANGFAQSAESITNLSTEIIEKNMGKLYVAFSGESEAIDNAMATFANKTGMNLKTDAVL